jgi:predicted kinase
MTRALIHLICGSTGAGKTTYARELNAQIQGVHFSIDDWMATLFWMDNAAPSDPTWAIERVERCMTQIWATAEQVATRGVPCILDFGFGKQDLRARFSSLAQAAGVSATLHFLDVPADERWRRVQQRNKDQSGQLSFAITREMFDFVESLWEPPSIEEMQIMAGLRIVEGR